IVRGIVAALGTRESHRALLAFLREETNLRAVIERVVQGGKEEIDLGLLLLASMSRAYLYGGRAPSGVGVLASFLSRRRLFAMGRTGPGAMLLEELGDLRVRVAAFEGARDAYQQALPLYREVHNRTGEANTLKAMGDLRMHVEDLDGARDAYQQAL